MRQHRAPVVFISYRREDASGHAGRLYDRLVGAFGRDNVFIDVDAISPGTDLIAKIQTAITRCDVVLAVIGKQWQGGPGPAGVPRLHDESDFVHLELASALRQGRLIIPVLVQDTPVPGKADLPRDLWPLTRLEALSLDDVRWRQDVDRLTSILSRRTKAGVEKRPRSMISAGGIRRRSLILLVLSVAVVGVVALVRRSIPDTGANGQTAALPLTGSLGFTVGLKPTTLGTLPPGAGLATIDLDTRSITRVSGIPKGACCGSWSPDGTMFAFETSEGIWTISRNGGEARLVLRSPGGSLTFGNSGIGRVGNLQPSWSPNGELIAYSFDPGAEPAASGDSESGNQVGIWAVDLDGQRRTQLTATPRTALGDVEPSWAPGHDLAFVRPTINKGFGYRFSIMRTLGADRSTEEELLGGTGEIGEMAWSPDGRSLAFTRFDAQGGLADIWVVEEDGSSHPLVTGPFDDRDPVWSPNGDALAFVSDRGGDYDVYVLSGSTIERITETADTECCLSWTS